MSAERISELNDAFRKGERPELGRIVITSGVRDLVSPYPVAIACVYDKVKTFDAFTEDNNPHGERDFGSFEYAGRTLFWKIDYMDKKMEYGSEDPADETKTTRLLVVMLDEEY